MARFSSSLLAQLLLVAHGTLGALEVDVENQESIKAAADLVAQDLMSFYKGNEPGEIPGILPNAAIDEGDYYWWNGAILWDTMLDYRERADNTTYDNTITQGLYWQIGQNEDYLPANFSASIGNDDQDFWALAAMSAAQMVLPAKDPEWVVLAQNVFDDQSSDERRVDEGSCEGALRWQLFPSSNGYNYVSTTANAAYFNLGAQLAHFNQNDTAADEAIDTYDTLSDIGFITDDFDVFDGASSSDCDEINRFQFSYTAALLLEGSAYLYNKTGDDVWKTRVDGLLDRSLELFFPDGVAFEVSCEESENCNTDMQFFKGILHRSMASTVKMAPYTAEKILPILKSSAKAAVAQCSGGDNGRMCGFAWSSGEYDGNSGAGAQSSVLGALVSIMTGDAETSSSGNNSGSGGNGTADDAASDNSTNGNVPDSLGTKVCISVGAMMGALLLGSLLFV